MNKILFILCVMWIVIDMFVHRLTVLNIKYSYNL